MLRPICSTDGRSTTIIPRQFVSRARRRRGYWRPRLPHRDDRGGHAVRATRAANGTITVGDFALFVVGIVQIQVSSPVCSSVRAYESLSTCATVRFLERHRGNLEEETLGGPDLSSTRTSAPLSADPSRRAGMCRFTITKAASPVGETARANTSATRTRLFEPTRPHSAHGVARSASAREVQCEIAHLPGHGQYQMTARENIG